MAGFVLAAFPNKSDRPRGLAVVVKKCIGFLRQSSPATPTGLSFSCPQPEKPQLILLHLPVPTQKLVVYAGTSLLLAGFRPGGLGLFEIPDCSVSLAKKLIRGA